MAMGLALGDSLGSLPLAQLWPPPHRPDLAAVAEGLPSCRASRSAQRVYDRSARSVEVHIAEIRIHQRQQTEDVQQHYYTKVVVMFWDSMSYFAATHQFRRDVAYYSDTIQIDAQNRLIGPDCCHLSRNVAALRQRTNRLSHQAISPIRVLR